jgi:DNA-binding transcriptional regulator YiaG
LIDANLGSGLIKQRVARPGEGRRRGFRTLIAIEQDNGPFSCLALPKAIRQIKQADERDRKAFAALLLGLDARRIETMLSGKELTEVRYEEESGISNRGRGRRARHASARPRGQDSHARIRCTLLDKSRGSIRQTNQALREREGVTQSVLAHILNVTTNYVSQLERGAKRPAGSTLKLLWLIRTKGLDAVM